MPRPPHPPYKCSEDGCTCEILYSWQCLKCLHLAAYHHDGICVACTENNAHEFEGGQYANL